MYHDGRSVKLLDLLFFFFFKQKTAYEVRISDWSSDVCSSDLIVGRPLSAQVIPHFCSMLGTTAAPTDSEIAEIVSHLKNGAQVALTTATKTPHMLSGTFRSEEHTSELQSLMRISYAVFCLKKKK